MAQIAHRVDHTALAASWPYIIYNHSTYMYRKRDRERDASKRLMNVCTEDPPTLTFLENHWETPHESRKDSYHRLTLLSRDYITYHIWYTLHIIHYTHIYYVILHST